MASLVIMLLTLRLVILLVRGSWSKFGRTKRPSFAVLQETLNLTQNAVEATYGLQRHFGQKTWLRRTMDMNENDEETESVLQRLGIHAATILNLRRGLIRLTRGKEFMVEGGGTDSVQTILKYLLGGRHAQPLVADAEPGAAPAAARRRAASESQE